MWVCQESEKQKHTSHCYYLLLDNSNIWIVSETSREALKIATRTVILMHSNSVFHGICICKKKDPLLQVKVYSNINNLISPDVKNVCFAGDYKVVFLFFPSQNRKFSNITNAIIFKHCAEIKIRKRPRTLELHTITSDN